MPYFKWLFGSSNKKTRIVSDRPPPVQLGCTDWDLLLCRLVRESIIDQPAWTYLEPRPGSPWISNGTWWIGFFFEYRERELAVMVMNQVFYDLYQGRKETIDGCSWLGALLSSPLVEAIYPELKRLVRKFDLGDTPETRQRVLDVVTFLCSESDQDLADKWRAARCRLLERLSRWPRKWPMGFLNEDGTVAVPIRKK